MSKLCPIHNGEVTRKIQEIARSSNMSLLNPGSTIILIEDATGWVSPFPNLLRSFVLNEKGLLAHCHPYQVSLLVFVLFVLSGIPISFVSTSKYSGKII